MQPSGIAGVHHAPEPPIRVNDEVVALPILAGGCTSRTATNDGSVFQPPRHRQFPNIQAHTALPAPPGRQPGTTSFSRLSPLKRPQFQLVTRWETVETTFCQLLPYSMIGGAVFLSLTRVDLRKGCRQCLPSSQVPYYQRLKGDNLRFEVVSGCLRLSPANVTKGFLHLAPSLGRRFRPF